MITKGHRAAFLAVSAAFLATVVIARGAGVTVITHGLNGDTDGWVTGMANQIPSYTNFPGATYTLYKLHFVSSGGGSFQPTWSRTAGSAPSGTDSGEIIIVLDWRQLADGNSFNTYEIAAPVASALQNASFVSELNGHAFSELPLHFIGHSRGGSLISEISLHLGTNGVWVDHLTTLDPHPLNDPAFPLDSLLYSAVDAPARTYENVLFHDNYWQELDFFVYGQPVSGSYVRELYSLPSGYSLAHSDVHLWYHATVDERNPADDTEAQVTNSQLGNWYVPYEDNGANAGFRWSLIGGGNRASPDRPLGIGSPAIRDGYNQTWDLGAGENGNRTLLPANNGNWPNVIKLNVMSTNQVQQGTNIAVMYYYQWARPETSAATLSFYLDDDSNPLNDNNRLLRQVTVPGTGALNVNVQTLGLELNASNAPPPGDYRLYAGITGGGRTRYLYAPEVLTVSAAPVISPLLSAGKQGANVILKWPTNAPGFVLQWATNLGSGNWSNATPLPTIVSGEFTVTNSLNDRLRFYRLRKP